MSISGMWASFAALTIQYTTDVNPYAFRVFFDAGCAASVLALEGRKEGSAAARDGRRRTPFHQCAVWKAVGTFPDGHEQPPVSARCFPGGLM